MTELEPIVPDAVWRGHGDAAALRVRIVDTLRDGRVLIHRLPGGRVPEEGLRRDVLVSPEQLRAAFRPTDERDFGSPDVAALHGPPGDA